MYVVLCVRCQVRIKCKYYHYHKLREESQCPLQNIMINGLSLTALWLGLLISQENVAVSQELNLDLM